MANKEKIIDLWAEIDKQNWDNLFQYFTEDAVINWNNSNESFNVNEFVRANCEYPGNWRIDIERLEAMDDLVVSVVKVELKSSEISFRATSFFEFDEDKIRWLNEYWGDNAQAPQWRVDMNIGKPIINT
ncbi:nuclear transport factor 2 family protein [Paenibacillus segetis]|uniref:SnoaL-like domain-containing protein n=1 Tax=Paenibacillus segetis TaxID=1325360 RepID=A0ABQ1Y9Q0_9BACL|nr:nuclear transport factor 2 family protein [Paenibacillus segetis]GGH16182.1 hypothetical protein GCM10008013_10820 [Paenibacillus segetis]